VPKPILQFKNTKLVGVCVGPSHCLAWDSEGLLYSWGD
jgi:alpha-tubulin suppressor-like RCC1 family protein